MEYNTKARGHPTESDRRCHRKRDILRWDREKLGVLCCFSTGELSHSAASLLLCCRGSSQTTPARDLPESLIQLHLIYTHTQPTALRRGRALRCALVTLAAVSLIRVTAFDWRRRADIGGRSASEIIVIIVTRAGAVSATTQAGQRLNEGTYCSECI